MSLLHALISTFVLCVAIFYVWMSKAFVSGFGPKADRNRAIIRFCGAVIIGATAIEGVVALLAR
jgi:hypothetical protein